MPDDVALHAAANHQERRAGRVDSRSFSRKTNLSMLRLATMVGIMTTSWCFGVSSLFCQVQWPTKLTNLLSWDGDIVFSGDKQLVISEIAICAIGAEEIVILDQRQKTIFCFNKRGALRYRIDRAKVDSVLPGYQFSPFNVALDSTGSVYVQSDAQARGEMLRFAHDGTFKGKIRYAERNNAFHFAVENNKLISYIVQGPDEMYLRVTELSGNTSLDFGRFPKQFRNAIYRTPVISLAVGNGMIYQIHCVEPTVYVYDMQGHLHNTFTHTPAKYVPIEHDLPVDFMSATKKDMAWTTTEAIFLIDFQHLLIQFLDRQQKAFLVMIMRTDGTMILDAVPVPERVVAARDGYVYFASQPEPSPDGYLPNPMLRKAKLKAVK